MRRAWRWPTVVAIAASAATAAQLAAAGLAQAAAPTITIAASAKLAPVTGDVLVIYHGGAYASGRIHGTITGAAAGDVATLYAQQFPFRKPATAAGSITLTAATATYSFTVQPSLVTRYVVRLSGTGTPGAPVATSPAQNLYVTAGGSATGAKACSRPVCHETIHLYTVVPASALLVESVKHEYPYFGLTLGSAGTPAPPAWLYLNAGGAKVTTARRVSATEFENTLTLSFTVGDHSYNYEWATCSMDTESKDGMGLPGHHGCGASRVLATVAYLG